MDFEQPNNKSFDVYKYMGVADLCGSRVDDLFKKLHKRKDLMDGSMYGIDVDFAWISKHPVPHVSAWVDIKSETEISSYFNKSPISGFSHVLLYNLLRSTSDVYLRAPVFFIEIKNDKDFLESNTDSHRFDIHLFMGGDHRPSTPIVNTRIAKMPGFDAPAENIDWAGLKQFEQGIREWRQREVREWIAKTDAQPQP